ncbi:2'-5'-oligoadenylate synthase-like protein 2 [Branchiostoma floridae x Branchiostoma japonicum]
MSRRGLGDSRFRIFILYSPGADINKYISEHLQTDEEYCRECSDVVDRVATFFKERTTEFKVNRFIKGGSLGKGTAIKSKSDIDCVMFTSNLPSIDSDDYRDQLQLHLEWVEKKLKESSASISFNFDVLGRTSHAVKLRVRTRKRGHDSNDVDLLLATDLLGECPTDEKKAEVYAMMGRMTPSVRENCSAALVELQRDFVKKQPAEVKDLIRGVREKSLTSYPLELLCIHTWRSYMSIAAAFEAVLRKLSDYKSVCAYWTNNYSTITAAEMLNKRPLILDPANPYNNVADRCRNWDAVAWAARLTLQKPFFRTEDHPSVD